VDFDHFHSYQIARAYLPATADYDSFQMSVGLVIYQATTANQVITHEGAMEGLEQLLIDGGKRDPYCCPYFLNVMPKPDNDKIPQRPVRSNQDGNEKERTLQEE
jgi:hypothetical protein